MTSTIDETYDSDEEFTVQQILAERSINNQPTFLVEWEGYTLYHASWEPAYNLKGKSLRDWEKIKKLTGGRNAPGFRVQQWVEFVEDAVRRKRSRHERRNRRRIAAGREPTEWRCEKEGYLPSILKSMDEAVDADERQPATAKPTVVLEDSSDDDRSVLDTLRLTYQRQKAQSRTNQPNKDASKVQPDDAGDGNASPSGTPSMSKKSSKLSGSRSSPRRGKSRSSPKAAKLAKNRTPTTPRPVTSTTVPGTLPMGSRTPLKPHFSRQSDTSTKDACVMTNVFAGGQTPRQGRKLLDSVLDASQEPKMLRTRHQNLAQKLLRDREGLRDPRALTSNSSHPGSAPGTPLSGADAGGNSIAGSPVNNRRYSIESSPPANPAAPEGGQPSSKDAGSQGALEQGSKKRKRSVRFVDSPEDRGPGETGDRDGLFVAQGDVVSDASLSPPVDAKGLSSAHGNIEAVRKECLFGPKSAQSLSITFHGLRRDEVSSWAKHFRSQSRLVFTHSCAARDFMGPLLIPKQKEVLRGSLSEASNPVLLKSIANKIELGAIGLLCLTDHFYVLVFPSGTTEWPGRTDGTAAIADSALNFAVFTPAEFLQKSTLAPLSMGAGDHAGASGLASDSCIPAFDLVFGSVLDTMLPPVSRGTTTHSFFLAFPPSAQQEAFFISQWLRGSGADCDIKSSLRPGDWMRFVEQGHGILILHEKAGWAVRLFPKFSQVLHAPAKSFSFWLFRRTLLSTAFFTPAPPLPGVSAEMFPIFRPGMAILVTPSFLVSQPQQAYNFFRWFALNLGKDSLTYQPGMLVACSGLDEYLLGLAEEKSEISKNQKHNRQVAEMDIAYRVKSWKLVRGLMNENVYQEGGLVECAPDTIDGNDEQSLVNWFGEWTIKHMCEIRKFSVLGSNIEHPDRMTRLIQPPVFESPLPMDQDQARDGKRYNAPRLISSDAATSIKDVLADADRSVRLLRCPLVVYRFPVSYWHADMAWHFGDAHQSDFHSYSDWVGFSTRFYKGRWRKESDGGGFLATTKLSTHCSLFYTTEGTWDPAKYQKGSQPDHRHPWVAIYRPVNPHKRPWREAELFIWDSRSWDKTSDDWVPPSALLEAQLELIGLVESQSMQNVGLPLSCVWLGSFVGDEPRTGSSHPLDITLDWLGKLGPRIRDWVPATQEKLPAAGWRLVKATQVPALPTGPAPRRSLADQDAEELRGREAEGAAKRIFQPPQVPGRKYGAGINRNMLFEWAEARRKAGERGPCSFQFQPTVSWYNDQLQDGCGYQHIGVWSWEQLFERYSIASPDEA